MKSFQILSFFILSASGATLADDCSFVCNAMPTTSEIGRCRGTLASGKFQTAACAVCLPQPGIGYDPNCMGAIINKNYSGAEITRCADVSNRQNSLAATTCLLNSGTPMPVSVPQGVGCDFDGISSQLDSVLNLLVRGRISESVLSIVHIKEQVTACKPSSTAVH